MPASSTTDLRLSQYPKTGVPQLDIALAPVYNAIRLLQQNAQTGTDSASSMSDALAQLNSTVQALGLSLTELATQLESFTGIKIHSSLINPANSQGNNGDLWIVANRTAWFKVGGTWGVVLTSGTPNDASYRYTFSWGDATPALITGVALGAVIHKVELIILEAFDVPSTLSVGDSADNDRLLAASSTDLTIVTAWEANPNYTYIAATDIELYISLGAGNSAGTGVILIYT